MKLWKLRLNNGEFLCYSQTKGWEIEFDRYGILAKNECGKVFFPYANVLSLTEEFEIE